MSYHVIMEKQSKKELLVVVERQGDQLKRYEARLRGTYTYDVIYQSYRAFIPKYLLILPSCFPLCKYYSIKVRRHSLFKPTFTIFTIVTCLIHAEEAEPLKQYTVI